MTSQTEAFLKELETLFDLKREDPAGYTEDFKKTKARVAACFEKAVEAEISRRFADDGK